MGPKSTISSITELYYLGTHYHIKQNMHQAQNILKALFDNQTRKDDKKNKKDFDTLLPELH